MNVQFIPMVFSEAILERPVQVQRRTRCDLFRSEEEGALSVGGLCPLADQVYHLSWKNWENATVIAKWTVILRIVLLSLCTTWFYWLNICLLNDEFYSTDWHLYLNLKIAAAFSIRYALASRNQRHQKRANNEKKKRKRYVIWKVKSGGTYQTYMN